MAIVRLKKNNVPYKYLGNNKFKNLITLKEGEVVEDKAKEIFAINLDATVLFNQYPEIKNLIHTLQLRIEPKI